MHGSTKLNRKFYYEKIIEIIKTIISIKENNLLFFSFFFKSSESSKKRWKWKIAVLENQKSSKIKADPILTRYKIKADPEDLSPFPQRKRAKLVPPPPPGSLPQPRYILG